MDSVLITSATGTGTLRLVWHVTGSVGVSWSSSDPQAPRRETVTRVVKELKQDGWLEQQGKRYLVPAAD